MSNHINQNPANDPDFPGMIDDTEGNLRRVPQAEDAEDAEGNIRRVPQVEDAEDAEGHLRRPQG